MEILCATCAAEDCALSARGRAINCRFYVRCAEPFAGGLVDEKDISEHYRHLKEEGFYATRPDGEAIRRKAEKK